MPLSFDIGGGAPDPQIDLAHLGWHADPPPTRSSVEVARSTGWTVARIWSTSCKLKSQPLPWRTTRTIATVDGAAEVTVNGKTFNLTAGQIIVLGNGDEVTVEHEALWARFEWILRSSMSGMRIDAWRTPVAVPDGYQHLLGAITNTLVMAPAIGRTRGAALLLEMLSGTVTSLVASASDLPLTMTPHQIELYDRAIDIIDDQYSDPSFDVQALSKLVPLSVSTLHAVFQAAGTTPRRAMEERRVRAALIDLSKFPVPEKGAFERVALSSGFTSAKQLRSALARIRQAHDAETEP